MNRKLQTKNGFTLIEVLLAMILVGLAIASLLAAAGSFTTTNAAGAESTTAEFLIEQIRELTTMKAYNDLPAFNGKTYSHPNGPIDSNGKVLDNFAAYSQRITVENVSDTDFTAVGDDLTSKFVRVTVKIFLNSKEISSESWIRANIGS
jgi:prepilin-type N-terminal cleavage/methylation domain-containing protein